MRFEILGPLRVTDGSGTRPVAGIRQQVLLGALLVRAGQPVSAGQLAEIIWDGAPPKRAVPTLRTYIARLRQALGADAAARILTRDRGYLASVGQGELDVLDFEALYRAAGAAVRAEDWAAVAEHAAGALALWRGPPLGEVPSQALREAWLPRFDEQHLQAIEWHVEARLQLGHHEEMVPQLRQLIAEHPLRERFSAQLMWALAHCGQQAGALFVYRDTRKVLVEELGIEPGADLRQLHERILVGDSGSAVAQTSDGTLSARTPAALPAAGAGSGDTPGASVPHQLPAAARHFTGRRNELALISSLHKRLEQIGTPSYTIMLLVIDGMAGVGKTALAVYAAHRLADLFPDGQLFLDLHGYTEGHPPREASDALGTLLRSLGIPTEQIPAEPEERARLYRQCLADTRTLIVLDNACSEAQVRQLLPSTPGCLVLITSRRTLKGLHDANIVALDVLPEADAVALLDSLSRPPGTTNSVPGMPEIAALCGRLPLALCVAGAQLRHRPAWTPQYLSGLLDDEQQRLAALSDGDHDLRAAFDLSYAALDKRQQLLFRRLALIPGPELDAFAAASLLDADPAAATRLLEGLVDHNLLIEPVPGRYRLHDLVRFYAHALGDDDSQPDRDSALDRLLRYYTNVSQGGLDSRRAFHVTSPGEA